VSLSLAISPCPNDTFVFHALVHGLVPGAPAMDVTYADVDVTNTAAQQGRFDLVKVSYAALPWLLDSYELLPCGGALGRGCGPLVLVRETHTSVEGLHVAVPGDRTTAYLLMRLW
jgi:1,4-dihydroxy-6-naphthoate synthase